MIAEKHFTSAVKKAARGTLDIKNSSNRSVSIYGFKDRALKMSSDEIKSAWKAASYEMKKKRD